MVRVIYKLVLLSLFFLGCSSTPPKEFDQEGVAEVVNDNKSDIQECYEMAMQKDDSLQGKITMAWEVTSGGNARNISVKSGDVALRKSETLTTCMIRKIRLWSFPKAPAGQVANVSFPFILSPEKNKKHQSSESDE